MDTASVTYRLDIGAKHRPDSSGGPESKRNYPATSVFVKADGSVGDADVDAHMIGWCVVDRLLQPCPAMEWVSVARGQSPFNTSQCCGDDR